MRAAFARLSSVMEEAIVPCLSCLGPTVLTVITEQCIGRDKDGLRVFIRDSETWYCKQCNKETVVFLNPRETEGFLDGLVE